MNITGRPEELAAFIRALNDEPVYIVEEPAKLQPIAAKPATKARRSFAIPIVAACTLLAVGLGLAFSPARDVALQPVACPESPTGYCWSKP
jgi:hypothetical protein